MKAVELYQREPIEVTKDMDWLFGFYYNHIPEIDKDAITYNDNFKNEKVEVRFYKNHCFDGRRVWVLASVWFDDTPVMIVQNAGREGDDYVKRFVTNSKAYREMVDYIKSLIPKQEEEIADLYADNVEIPKLDNFYDYFLDGVFDHW